MRMSRVHCAVLNARTRLFLVPHFHSVTAAMARGKRPVTFRTRKLSLSAPMVLPWRRGGRVGRRRTTIPEGAPASVLGPLRHARSPAFGSKSRGVGGLSMLPGHGGGVERSGCLGGAGGRRLPVAQQAASARPLICS